MSAAKNYEDLHRIQLRQEAEGAKLAANAVIDIVSQVIDIRSVLDVGCGIGTWLRVFQDRLGCEARGVEGDWLDPALLEVDKSLVAYRNLANGFDLGQKFDLVLSIEVAEHLPASCAKQFVESLISHGNAIVFSAAVPGQGGTGHFNERFVDYWIDIFRGFDYVPLDILRGRIWNDQRVPFWLRQNLLLFSRENLSAKFLQSCRPDKPFSIVHPQLYMAKLLNYSKLKAKYEQLVRFLEENSHFSVVRNSHGELVLKAGSSTGGTSGEQ